MYYDLIKSILFRLQPETAHRFTLRALRAAHTLGLQRYFPKPLASPCKLMGLNFINPLGLAAGLDKNGDYIDALAALGFGFLEVGTVTPKPQIGNPLPRLLRVKEHQALINRMGFNNKGVDYLVKQLQTMQYQGIIGVNIGKNADTPLATAYEDYVYCFRRVAPFASYVTLNISSPNTADLRDLQHADLLHQLLLAVKKEQILFQELQNKRVPIVVKISPDLNDEALQVMAEIFLKVKIDGVIATNTTLNHQAIEGHTLASESGGLSGKPLMQPATEVLRKLHVFLKNQIPLIASGGVMTEADVLAKLAAGAELVQVYTGLIYHGPGLITAACERIANFVPPTR